jgi:hypothetical protein
VSTGSQQHQECGEEDAGVLESASPDTKSRLAIDADLVATHLQIFIDLDKFGCVIWTEEVRDGELVISLR